MENRVKVYDDWEFDIKERVCYKDNKLAFRLVVDPLPPVKSSFVDRNVDECERYRVDKKGQVYSGGIPLGIIKMCIDICKSIK